jgi:nucleoside-diphosphate-sugar epimerase
MYLATMQNNLKTAEIFNITNDAPLLLKDALNTIFSHHMGLKFNIVNIPYNIVKYIAKFNELKSYITNKEPDLTSYAAGVLSFDMTLDIEKSKNLLDFSPIVDISEAMRNTANSLSLVLKNH